MVNWLNKCDFGIKLDSPKNPFSFETVFNKYPEFHRIKETKCRASFDATVKNEKDFKAIQDALSNYLTRESKKPKGASYMDSHNWFAEWRDWMPSA
jgi:hypothetical protein